MCIVELYVSLLIYVAMVICVIAGIVSFLPSIFIPSAEGKHYRYPNSFLGQSDSIKIIHYYWGV